MYVTRTQSVYPSPFHVFCYVIVFVSVHVHVAGAFLIVVARLSIRLDFSEHFRLIL